MGSKGYILDHEGTASDNIRYDDMQSEINTAPAGAAQWATAQIGSTGFFINWLQAGQDDFFQIKLQMSHRKALGTELASIHVHYILSAAPNNGDTVLLNYSYVFLKDGDAVPLIASWTSDTKTITFTGSEAAETLYMTDIVTNVAAPTNEEYSSILLLKVTRNSQGIGADTYAGNFGLLYVDGHMQVNRLGSVQEYTD